MSPNPQGGNGSHSRDDEPRQALSEALSQATDPLVVLNRIVAQALVLIPAAEGATVELADTGELVYVCCGGSLTSHVGLRLAIEGSFSGLSVTTNRVMRCDDAEDDPRVDLEACRKVGAVSMVCVPLRRPGGAIGVLKVASAHPRAFTDKDVAVLEHLAPFITTAVAAASDLSKVIPPLLNSPRAGDYPGSAPPRAGGAFDQVQTGALTEFIANVMKPGMAADVSARQTILAALRPDAIAMVAQPIYRLDSGELFGVEALARFQGPPLRSPDRWFAEAHRVGLGIELELAAVRQALSLVEQVPSSVHLAINVGPAAAADPHLDEMLSTVDASRVVIELTEHVEIDDYPALRTALSRYRDGGSKLAADDTGSGISGLTHILRLAPDYIKLDCELTRGIEIDPVRQSLAAALVAFASQSGAEVIAEGIEAAEALQVLTDIGVPYGQGYHLGRPGPIGQQHLHHSEVAGT